MNLIAMVISPIGAVVWLVIGAVSGWLAGQLIKGHGFGLGGNIVVGIIGAVVGGWLFGLLGVSVPGGPLVGSILTSVAGAMLLLFVIGVLKVRS